MDGEAAVTLLRDDTTFGPGLRPLRCLEFAGQATSQREIDATDLEALASLGTSILPNGSLRVLWIPQSRRYFENSTRNHIELPQSAWLEILSSCAVPPPALELLHDNNGGCFQHDSYCNDSPRTCGAVSTGAARCAYHACFKLCQWGEREHFMYGRYDFHSQTTFVLVAGTSDEKQALNILQLFPSFQELSLPSVLYVLACVWAKEVEAKRWTLDYRTQALEAQTGASSLQFPGVRPLEPEQFEIRPDMMRTMDWLRGIHRASNHIGELYRFLDQVSERFQRTFPEDPADCDHTVVNQRYEQLSDAIKMRISQQRWQATQIQSLQDRVGAQWDFVNALISHHSNRLNFGMAKDSRDDSVLMRRISFVTVFFLPATFMATFFSMGFFIVDDASNGGLRVSWWIWLYVVCTAPLTVVVGWQYAPASNLWESISSLGRGRKTGESYRTTERRIDD